MNTMPRYWNIYPNTMKTQTNYWRWSYRRSLTPIQRQRGIAFIQEGIRTNAVAEGLPSHYWNWTIISKRYSPPYIDREWSGWQRLDKTDTLSVNICRIACCQLLVVLPLWGVISADNVFRRQCFPELRARQYYVWSILTQRHQDHRLCRGTH